MQTLTEQLRDAFERSQLSVAALLAKSGLPIDRSSLSRKLAGKLRLKTDEAEVLATTLGTTIAWPQRGKRGA